MKNKIKLNLLSELHLVYLFFTLSWRIQCVCQKQNAQ